MLKSELVEELIINNIDTNRFYLLSLEMKNSSIINVFIESFNKKDSFNLENIIKLSRAFNTEFDRDDEDYELNISSAGLDLPFRDIRQYTKYLNDFIDVYLLNGQKRVEVELVSVDKDFFEIEYETKEKIEGKKKKELIIKKEKIYFKEINSTKKSVFFK